MRESDYAFAVGRTWVIETRLLDSGKFDRMLDAKDAEEVFRILGETEYAQAFATIKNPADFEAALDFERHRVFRLIRNLLEDGEDVGELYFLRFDVHNLKVLFKARMTGQGADGLVKEGVFGPKRIAEAVSGESGDGGLPEFMSEWIAAARGILDRGDLQLVDLTLDGAFFRYAAHYAWERSWGALTRYWVANIDLTNIITMFRCRRLSTGLDYLRKALIEDGELPIERFLQLFDAPLEEVALWLQGTSYRDLLLVSREALQSLTALEASVRAYLHSIVVEACRKMAVGPEPIFAYLLAKESEIQRIRVILVGKLNGIPREALRERLLHA